MLKHLTLETLAGDTDEMNNVQQSFSIVFKCE